MEHTPPAQLENGTGSGDNIPDVPVDQTETDDPSAPNDERQALENTYTIDIRLPHAPHLTQTIVSTQDQAQDVKQSLTDLPHTSQYSCFHLECNGERIPDFIDFADLPTVKPNAVLDLVEDPYTEKEARLHVLRVRDLIGIAGDRTESSRGIQAGLTLLDKILIEASHSLPADGFKSNSPTVPANVTAIVNYDIAGCPSLAELAEEPDSSPPQTLKSLSLSAWNPPPYHLRSKGHLLYLAAVTLEGEIYHITSHVTGFFVNRSSANKFDPTPRVAPRKIAMHSLLSLLTEISPLFGPSFQKLQEYNSSKDALSLLQLTNALPANPWIISQANTLLSTHQPDLCRNQETYLVGGAENSETLRDWNEEFQTTRELPRESVQDRVFRERVTSKLFADYNEAATQGAVLIARNEVAPLNPTEPKDAHIFVYNNIFYSFGADGVGTFAAEGGDEAARVATGKDALGVRTVNQLDIPSLSTPGTAIIDYLGRRIVAQSIVPGIFKQREPGEQQIDYGGVEGRDVVVKNDAFVPLFKKLSSALHVKEHHVWDKERHRHDLEASIETKGLLGTDGRKYVLDLYRITPLDVSWLQQFWEPYEHSDEEDAQRYPHRMAVLRPELIDGYWKLKVREYIREQLAKKNQDKDKSKSIEAMKNGDAQQQSNSTEDGPNEGPEKSSADASETQGNDHDRIDISGFDLAFNVDVFCGQYPQTDEEKLQWEKDEEDVRAISTFLLDVVIPRLMTDLRDGEVGFPMDGQSLCSLLHKRGINIRYLGQLAHTVDKSNWRMLALQDLATREMISRAFKHISARYMKHLPAPIAPSCVSHLLNCLLGSSLNEFNKPEIDSELKEIYRTDSFAFEHVTCKSLHEELANEVYVRYRYTLALDWVKQISSIQMLREIALKLGLQLVNRDYHFTHHTKPSSNGTNSSINGNSTHAVNGTTPSVSKKKRKPADKTAGSPLAEDVTLVTTFRPEDILNICPIVKEASPRSSLADEALEAGRISVAQDQRELGQELLLESLSLNEQIYGIIHPEVARVYYQLSSLFYSLEDKQTAVELARKAVIVSERTLGLDAAETVLGYLNLSLFEHAVGNTLIALSYTKHALELWKIIYGQQHPDAITTLNNAAVMLQHLKLYADSRRWFEASLKLCQQTSGPNSIHTATLLFQLAQALALDSDSKGAVGRMREAYNIFNAELGPNDRNTKEAETWLEQLTTNAVSIAKHAKDVQTKRIRRLNQVMPRSTLGTRSPQSIAAVKMTAADQQPNTDAIDAAANAIAKEKMGARHSLDERSIDELLRYIEGNDGTKPTMKKRTTNPKRTQQRTT